MALFLGKGTAAESSDGVPEPYRAAQEEKVVSRCLLVKPSSDGQCNLLFSATFRLATQALGAPVGVDTTEGVVR